MASRGNTTHARAEGMNHAFDLVQFARLLTVADRGSGPAAAAEPGADAPICAQQLGTVDDEAGALFRHLPSHIHGQDFWRPGSVRGIGAIRQRPPRAPEPSPSLHVK